MTVETIAQYRKRLAAEAAEQTAKKPTPAKRTRRRSPKAAAPAADPATQVDVDDE